MNSPSSDASTQSAEIVKLDTAPELSPEERTQRKRRALLRRFWHSASLYWGKDGGKRAWLLTGGLLAIVLLNLASAYGMNVWNRAIFDALEKRDSSDVLFISLLYFPLLIASVCVAIAQVYARMTTQRHWRSWLSNHLFDRWIRDGRYYQLNLISGDHQNPEYRIADDVRIATESPVDFATGLTTAVLSALTFIIVLWTIGGALTIEVGGTQRHHSWLPGDRRRGLRADCQRLDGIHRTPVRHRFGEQEPVRGGIPLRADAVA